MSGGGSTTGILPSSPGTAISTGTTGILVPASVLERIPVLKSKHHEDQPVLFYDFGTQKIRSASATSREGELDGDLSPSHHSPTSKKPRSASVIRSSNREGPAPAETNRDVDAAASSPSSSAPPLTTSVPIVVVLTEQSLFIASWPDPVRPVVVVSLKAVAGVERSGDTVMLKCSTAENIELVLSKADTFVIHLIDIQDRRMYRVLHFAQQGGQQQQQERGQKFAPGEQGAQRLNGSQQQDKVPGLKGSKGVHQPDFAFAAGQSSDGRNIDEGRLMRQRHTSDAITGGRSSQPQMMDEWLEQANRTLRGVAVAQERPEYREAPGVVRFGHTSCRVDRPLRECDEGSDASSVQTIDHDVQEEDVSERMVEIPSLQHQTDISALHRRLWYFFLHYDRSKLPYIDEMLRRHRGLEAPLLQELEIRYGPEPAKERWEVHDRIAHQREVSAQLKAQLARGRDELLLLGREEGTVAASVKRVQESAQVKYRELMALNNQGPAKGRAAAEQKIGTSSPLHTALSSSQKPTTKLALYKLNDCIAKRICFFPAPSCFFDFVAHQVQSVPFGQEGPSCCLLEEVPPATSSSPSSSLQLRESFPGGGLDSSSGQPTTTTTKQGKGQRSLVANRDLLALWATQFGDHSVAVPTKGREDGSIPSLGAFLSSSHPQTSSGGGGGRGGVLGGSAPQPRYSFVPSDTFWYPPHRQ